MAARRTTTAPSTPQMLIPSLAIDGEIVTQSTALIEFIEEMFPGPLPLPRRPHRPRPLARLQPNHRLRDPPGHRPEDPAPPRKRLRRRQARPRQLVRPLDPSGLRHLRGTAATAGDRDTILLRCQADNRRPLRRPANVQRAPVRPRHYRPIRCSSRSTNAAAPSRNSTAPCQRTSRTSHRTLR